MIAFFLTSLCISCTSFDVQFEKLASPHWAVPGSTLRQGLTAVPEVKKLNPVEQQYHLESQHYNMFHEEALFYIDVSH